MAMAPRDSADLLRPSDDFLNRHIGPSEDERAEMLSSLGLSSLEDLVASTIPASIRLAEPLQLGPARTESEALAEIREIANENEVHRSFIGMGYYSTLTPGVIQRNILENPGWYTQYTPYQAEISQGRLEALLNFQTLICDLCELPLANSSLLDEATAAAEAMAMAFGAHRRKRNKFFVASDCHPQTIAVVQSRAVPLGIEVVVAELNSFDASGEEYFGVLLQTPNTEGLLIDPSSLVEAAHAAKVEVIVATDLLALTLTRSPGDFGADIAVGSSQRFGIPLGFGGPHAAFLAAREGYERLIPGRVIGVSKDTAGNPAMRLAMQTREQHIRRDKATSNICTAQVLLAVMAGMYAVYHGPDGLRRIASRVHSLTESLRTALKDYGHTVGEGHVFDSFRVTPVGIDEAELRARCATHWINLRDYDDGSVGISLDEATTAAELASLLTIFAPVENDATAVESIVKEFAIATGFVRETPFCTHDVFNKYHGEHEMLRYLHRLQSRDLSLDTSMIPLGSCTMKLNATSEMVPITWPEFASIHPFAPSEQWRGYARLFEELESSLAEITGFHSVSLQPNAGAQGEYAGLLVIRAHHLKNGDAGRNVCLIPVSAHGTNPASAVMAGMRVIGVACDDSGNIDVADLAAKAQKHASELAALMITYPSTHGVFEETVREVCEIIHANGGQVYMDGANMNAQVGLTRPGDMGADVCHLNLHKTFCIPHGGGGPGMGPIGVAEHLSPYLPGHAIVDCGGEEGIGPIAAAPYGSASVLPISWMYLKMMGESGLKTATQVAILNANYMAHRLRDHYPVLYAGRDGRVAHEFILDVRHLKESAGVSVDDFAKRLMDYGFHAPTMSWPVAGTLMIEPTESESKAELDRFCDAMIFIREEVRALEEGRADREDNVLRNAPHTLAEISRDDWQHAYTREEAAFNAPWLREYKFFASVARVDNAFGDRNLICTCPSVEDLAESVEA